MLYQGVAFLCVLLVPLAKCNLNNSYIVGKTTDYSGCQLYNKGCPKNWARFENSCYIIFKDSEWDSAKTECEISESNSHLVIINSEEENDFVLGLGQNEENLMLGLYWDESMGNTFYWVDGLPEFAYYIAWQMGQPEFPDGISELVAGLLPTGNWASFPLDSSPMNFVCEKERRAEDDECSDQDDLIQANFKQRLRFKRKDHGDEKMIKELKEIKKKVIDKLIKEDNEREEEE